MAKRSKLGKRAHKIVHSIIEAERVNDAWDKDMMAPPSYPRTELIAELNQCGSVALDVLLEVLRSGDGLARQQAAYLVDQIDHDDPSRVAGTLDNAARKKGKGQWAAARALARRDIAKAVESGLHLDKNTRRGVLPFLADGAERTAALETLFARGDARSLIDALNFTAPTLLSDPAIHSHVTALLAHDSIGIARSAGLLMCQVGGECLDAFVEAACKRPTLLDKRIVALVRDSPAASKLIVPLVKVLPAKTGRLDNAHSAHLLTLLRARLDGGEKLAADEHDIVVERLCEALTRRPSVRPKSWDVLGRMMLASGLVDDLRLVEPLVAIVSWDGGHGGALRSQLSTALSNYSDTAAPKLDAIVRAEETTDFARALAKDILLRIHSHPEP